MNLNFSEAPLEQVLEVIDGEDLINKDKDVSDRPTVISESKNLSLPAKFLQESNSRKVIH